MRIDYQLVRVDWEDSRHPDSGWTYTNDINNFAPACCHSVGWIIGETSDYVRIASHLHPSEGHPTQVMGVMTIPRRVIDAIHALGILNAEECKLFSGDSISHEMLLFEEESFRISDDVSAWLRKMSMSPRKALENGLAEVENGNLVLRTKNVTRGAAFNG